MGYQRLVNVMIESCTKSFRLLSTLKTKLNSSENFEFTKEIHVRNANCLEKIIQMSCKTVYSKKEKKKK